MLDNLSSNKRIAKNTLFLYLRQFIVLVVALFTTRIVLRELGDENYGIYNLVAGVVVMLSIVTSTMSSATQRYLSIGVASGDKQKYKEIFNTCMCIYLGFAVICIILGETMGLRFVKTNLSLPDGRLPAAIFVFHMALFNFVLEILKTPYDASIIAHEKMDVYAYFSIFTVVLQLIMVYLISVIDDDPLVVYSVIMSANALISASLYVLYCRIKLNVSAIPLSFNRTWFKEIFSFSFWSLFGSLATIGVRQTMNILLNVFFGVKVNAAASVATKLSTQTNTLVSSFTTAYTPQIYKLFSKKEYDSLNGLIMRTTSISFFLCIILMVPMLLVMDDFLGIWLVDVPVYSSVFCRILMFYLLLDAYQYPLIRTVTAIGNIRNFQIFFSVINLMNIPIMWALFHLGLPPYTMYVVFVMFTFITAIYRIEYIKRKAPFFDLKQYTITTLRLLAVLVVSVVVSYYTIALVPHISQLGQLVAKGLIVIIITAIIIWFIGCRKQDRKIIMEYISTHTKNEQRKKNNN